MTELSLTVCKCGVDLNKIVDITTRRCKSDLIKNDGKKAIFFNFHVRYLNKISKFYTHYFERTCEMKTLCLILSTYCEHMN